MEENLMWSESIPIDNGGSFFSEVVIDEDLLPVAKNYLNNRLFDTGRMIGLLEEGKLDQIAKICHSIRGAAAPYGYPSLQDLASDVESSALRQETVEVKAGLIQILVYLAKYIKPVS
jgi:chemotaxis protein histidine kinase CheA